MRASNGVSYLQLIEDLVHDVVFALQVEGEGQYRFVYINPGFERATGLGFDQVVGKLVDEVIPPQSLPLVKEKYRQALLCDTATQWDEVSNYPSGTKVGEVTIRPVKDEVHKRQLLVGTVHDVTERYTAQARLAELEERWRLALDASDAAAWDWDSHSNMINFSSQWRELLGRDPVPLPADAGTLGLLIHPDDAEQVRETHRAVVRSSLQRFAFELRMRHADGHWIWVRCRGRAHCQSSGAIRILGTLIDVSAAKEAEHLLWHQANHDGLTGLPNRSFFMDRVRAAAESSRHAGSPMALLYVDLDEFKDINDTLGHAAGDRLLCQVARRIAACIAPPATVARLGGDEFTVLLLPTSTNPDLDEGDIEHAGRCILQALTEPFYVNSETLYISASIGIARCPDDGQNADSLLQYADQALYEAKRLGRNRIALFRPSLQKEAQRRKELIRDLRRAIRNDELEIHYQPIIHFATGQISKVEALLRWNHPRHGPIGPAEFIPLCEETGLIIGIGEWVFKTAVAQAARWQREGRHALKVGINVSPIQIRHGGDSCARCLDFMAAQELAPGTIVVEMTEGSLLHNDPVVKEQLHRMHEHGIELALDDFGTGYSALSYLQLYTFAYLKIDRSFVHEMETSSDKRALCETIILMAHRLGMQVIAEGVESAHGAELLRAAGCDFGQGFQFFRPMPARELEEQLAVADNGDVRRQQSLA